MKNLVMLAPLSLVIILSCSSPATRNGDMFWTDLERRYLLDELQASADSILATASSMGDSLWVARETIGSWSFAQVMEHLILQDRAYYREMKVVAALPYMPQYMSQVKGNDAAFEAYATDPQTSKSDWDVTPTGRFCSKREALDEFKKVRAALIDLVATSQTDFRQVFTFREIPEHVKQTNPDFYRIREVRDLHQLVLNMIAHTNRHHQQMLRIRTALR